MTSAALHLVFLLLAFAAPVANVLDQPAVPATWRTVEASAVEPYQPEARFQLEPGETGPGEGLDEPLGPRPLAKVGPAEDADEPSLAGATPTEFEDLEGVLAGVADETLGPDAEMALGRLDGGGGREHVFGFGMAGGGVSCARLWRHDPKTGEMIVERHEGCKAARIAMMRGIAGAVAAAREAVPDLGDKDEVELGVVTGTPAMQCGAEAARACDWKDVIGRVIRRHRRELRYCWQQTLKRQARAVDVEIAVTFELPPGGGRATVSVADSGLAGLDACVSSRARTWVFPETGERIRANYPFRFWSS